MNKKIIGMFVFMILIVSAATAVESLNINKSYPTIPNIIHTIERDNWTEIEKFLASDDIDGDSFDYTVSLSGDTASCWGRFELHFTVKNLRLYLLSSFLIFFFILIINTY